MTFTNIKQTMDLAPKTGEYLANKINNAPDIIFSKRWSAYFLLAFVSNSFTFQYNILHEWREHWKWPKTFSFHILYLFVKKTQKHPPPPIP